MLYHIITLLTETAQLNTLLFNVGLSRKWDSAVSSQRGESRVPGAAGFIGKLAVFHLLPAGACMHAPGSCFRWAICPDAF